MKMLFRGLNVFLRVALFAAGAASLIRPVPVYAASIPPALIFTPVVTGLTEPVLLTNAGDGSNRMFIVQQTGQIRIFKNGSLLATPFLDISGDVTDFTNADSEQGLLGLAFDPNYATNGFFYITYTTDNPDPTFVYTTTLARYKVSTGNADLADPSTATVILPIPKKFSNHNGGMIAFGPDGYLYMSMGDGGSGGDPNGNGQNLHTLLGKLLRLDVHTTPAMGQKYVIPPTNPFFSSSDPLLRKEIWAYGLRNPWRFSFDRMTGDLFIGDVGQDTEEEVDFQPAGSAGGQNYGWNIREGNLCFASCAIPASYVPPVATYDHGNNDSYGCSLTGGYIYRGSASPALQGVYFYADFCSGKVLGLIHNPDNTWTHSLITSTAYAISSFGQDEQGEVYLDDYGSGIVYRISATSVNISGNIGAAGVTLSYTDGAPKAILTQSDGSYSFTVPQGWSGTVTPMQACYAFSPGNRAYSNIAADQTAQNYTLALIPGCAAGRGIYDDTDAKWSYSGNSWSLYSGAGPYNNTTHYTNTPGSTASFTFNGTQFSYTYNADSNRGSVEIRVDGTLITTLNTFNPTILLQRSYASPAFSPGVHTVVFKFTGPSGKYLDIDAIQIINPDLLAPDPVASLASAPGTANGSINLSWVAPLNDAGVPGSGPAAAYLVRYSTANIATEGDWTSATPVSAGIPAPAAPGTTQTMTLTGLNPGITYFVAVRARDAQPNLGPFVTTSAAAKSPTPLGPGKYDDTDPGWLYVGSWSLYSGTGPYNNTVHYTNTLGNTAAFTFNGSQFTYTYNADSNRGSVEIRVDGTLITTLNTHNPTILLQRSYASPAFSPGVHTVVFKFTGPSGKFLDIDAIQISP